MWTASLQVQRISTPAIHLRNKSEEERCEADSLPGDPILVRMTSTTGLSLGPEASLKKLMCRRAAGSLKVDLIYLRKLTAAKNPETRFDGETLGNPGYFGLKRPYKLVAVL